MKSIRIVLSNILAVYRRELQSYFASPLTYLVAAFFWFLAGVFLVFILLSPSGIIAQVAAADQMGLAGAPVDVPYEFLKIYLNLLGSLSLFILPMLSMGLYTEERKQGTLELLATSPISNWVVALGKLLGVVTLYFTMLLPVLVVESMALGAADPSIRSVVPLLGHAGLVLLAASVLSLGMFLSSLTDSTVLAAIMTFALILLLWIIDSMAQGVTGVVGDALGHLSLLSHFDAFTQGILDTSGLVLFLSYILLGLLLTAQSVEAFRFQRN